MKRTLVIVTFDESEGNNKPERIYTVFLGAMVKPQEVTAVYDSTQFTKNRETAPHPSSSASGTSTLFRPSAGFSFVPTKRQTESAARALATLLPCIRQGDVPELM